MRSSGLGVMSRQKKSKGNNKSTKTCVDSSGISSGSCVKPMTPDSLPVLGALPRHPKVLCAFGHGHYGLTQGPTTGRIISRLAFGEDPVIDLSPFAVTRF